MTNDRLKGFTYGALAAASYGLNPLFALPLYIQMKGRGVRTIGDEQLRNVTPNAFSKDCFYLVVYSYRLAAG